jgi:hypothetical protein
VWRQTLRVCVWICLSVTGVCHTQTFVEIGRVDFKVRDISHLSHGEIVLVTSDDDILSYQV